MLLFPALLCFDLTDPISEFSELLNDIIDDNQNLALKLFGEGGGLHLYHIMGTLGVIPFFPITSGSLSLRHAGGQFVIYLLLYIVEHQ